MKKIRKRLPLIFILLFFLMTGWSQPPEWWKEKAENYQNAPLDTNIYYWHLIEDWAVEHKDSIQFLEAVDMLLSLYRLHENEKESANYAYQYLSLLHKDTYDNGTKATVLVNIGMSLENRDPQLSDSLFLEAETIANELQDTILLIQVNANFGHVKRSKGDLYGAIHYLTKALAFAKSDLSRASLCTNIANIFLSLKNHSRAEEYILQGIHIAEKNNYQKRNGAIAMIYASTLIFLERFEEAKVEIDRAISYLTHKKKWNSLNQAYNVLIDYHIQLNNWDAAAQSNLNAKKYMAEATPHMQCQTLFRQAKILMHQKQYDAALLTAQQALQIAQSMHHPQNIKNAYKAIATIQDKRQQVTASYDAFKEYRRLDDSIYRTTQMAQINFLEAQYKRKEQKGTIALLDTKNELQTAQLSQQKKLITIGGISLVLILGLLFFLYRLFQKIKNQNAIIHKALEEKDTLLREIHHRVKNNLQLVSSLLGLQSRHIEDPAALEALNSGKSRVKSMALIHQDLYNRENLTGVSVKDYLEKLCRELISTYQIDIHKIQLQTEIADLQLDVDTLVPLGLIINELLTNALKYAFPDGRKGQIKVVLTESDQVLRLEVSDNGIGMNPANISKSSFGYKLIETLLDQLDGKMQRKGQAGTHLSLIFKDYKIAA